ncbi:MAG: hypothetical protein IPJ86_11885 [Bacteroidetes bacterium]|nr:hypothetical protein [Bacteroidota bacterium]
MRQLKITQSITNRESASLEKYLQDIGKENMVTPQEEVVLAQRIRQGDQEALDKLTRANLRFVVSVAKQYQNQGMSLPDLINEGNLGLIKAAFLLDESLSEDINRSLSTLSKREAEVIKMFFGIGIKLSMSLDEIGIELGLTRERVRQIKETGLRRLKHNSRNKLLKTYL